MVAVEVLAKLSVARPASIADKRAVRDVDDIEGVVIRGWNIAERTVRERV